MPVPISVPKATISMQEATILKWFRTEGQAVAKGELLFEIETDKAVMEVPAPESGILFNILTEGGPVKPDQVVGWMSCPAEAEEGTAVHLTMPAPASSSTAVTAAPARPATPPARRRAKELGIELANMVGTGPSRRITEEDVDRFAQKTVLPLTHETHRRTLIRHVTTAWQTIPHIHVVRAMDARGMVEAKAKADPQLTFTDLLMFVVGRVLAASLC
jgi:pyruvate/2-oxoglutarate dehydrogenase complex dihydrolipoamide acyltransferase (E2) component